MPRGNGTGPMEMGSITGRGAGFCGGRGVAGFANSEPGLGFGRGRGGRGGGHGRRNMFYATGLTGKQCAAMDTPAAVSTTSTTTQQEVVALKEQAAALAEMLDSIRQRIDKIET